MQEAETRPQSTPSAQPTPSAPTVDPIIAPQPSGSAAISSARASEYAGFWIRFVAAMIDGIILSVVGGIVNSVFGLGSSFIIPSQTDPAGSQLGLLAGLAGAGFLLNTAINLVYYVGLTSAYGATLGKMVLGLRVVDENGQRIGFGKAALRETVGKFVSGIVLGIGYLWVAFDSKKQGWHDKIAGTYVVKIR